jgi:hypothetical protein
MPPALGRLASAVGVVLILIAISGALLCVNWYPPRAEQCLVGDVQVQRRASSSPQPLEVGDVVLVVSILQAVRRLSTLHFGHPSTWRTESAANGACSTCAKPRRRLWARRHSSSTPDRQLRLSLPKDNLISSYRWRSTARPIPCRAPPPDHHRDTTAVHPLGTRDLTASEYCGAEANGIHHAGPARDGATPLPTASLIAPRRGLPSGPQPAPPGRDCSRSRFGV